MATRIHAACALLGALSSTVIFQNAFFIAVVKGDENVVVQDKVSRARSNRRDGSRRQLGDSDGVFKELNAMDAMSGGRKAKGRKEKDNNGNNPFGKKSFEVWASDQSNSVKGVGSPGVEGSFLWIWDSNEIAKLVTTGKEAKPMGCPGKSDPTIGPCDVYDVFPKDLEDESGKTLGESDNFGRLHGMLTDPSNRYVTANMFAPGGGYVGIIDTKTRAAIGLFRITKFQYSAGTTTRSNHMSYFSEDGKSIIIANLNGKAMERIDITRNKDGTIKKLVFNKSASLGLGKGMSVAEDATFFKGKNSINEDLLGGVKGTYDTVKGLGDLTPNGKCKENGCPDHDDGEMGGRPNNLIICPIATRAGLGYITLAGGGLLVADIASNPMKIVGEYGQGIVYGAGCGGVQTADDQVFLNAGISASSAGSTQSMFALYSFNDNLFPTGGSAFNPENTPMPELVYQDTSTNTQTGGNVEGPGVVNNSGQLPLKTDRRDSHGAEVTLNSKYVHVTDRIQNVVEVFDTQTYERTTYDLTSKSGQAGRDGPAGPCWKRSVMDDAKLPRNDPAPDLMSIEPNGKYLMIAFRGPYPVSVNHSAQGSCPGVGIVELLDGGKSGRLVEVLRTTNIVDNVPFVSGTSAPGGHDYKGAERSDVHGAVVVARED